MPVVMFCVLSAELETLYIHKFLALNCLMNVRRNDSNVYRQNIYFFLGNGDWRKSSSSNLINKLIDLFI